MRKNPPASAGDPREGGLIPGLGKFPGVGTHSQYSWESHGQETDGLQPIGSQRARHNWSSLSHLTIRTSRRSPGSPRGGRGTQSQLHTARSGSPSPTKAPKLQLVVQQPSAERHWNPPKKDTPRPETKRKLQRNGRRNTIMIKIKFYGGFISMYGKSNTIL